MSEISDSSDVVPVKRGGKAVTFSLAGTAGEDDEKKPLLHGSAASGGGAYSGDRKLSSTALLGVERVLRTRSRLWSTALSAFVVSIPALLVGYTLGFASSALLDLTGGAADVPEAYLFNRLVSDLFAVSYVAYGKESHIRNIARQCYGLALVTKAHMPTINYSQPRNIHDL